ncbi:MULTISPECIES: DUF3995 domain-containing protein [unclassified Actinopolyspora]|uniref:DUF3995 domain-containing protein n=1 Tax=unclassified Actinopolyspora TaxID=2639451 RepID=UPI0013F65C35|nr:DUF3995 domain-containing protein [Actinopolyspora sp. BKK2]NHE75471.1 DUF3995 domain-containing protein [Actinopolyspora sp. BKK1]
MKSTARHDGHLPHHLALAWALLFAALSVFWALGGETGLHPLETPDPTPLFTLVNIGAAALKAGLGLVAWLAAREWRRRAVRGLLALALWASGVVCALYGVFGLVGNGLVLAGVVPVAGGVSSWYWYYVLLWDPFWVLGGALLLAAALRSGQPRETGEAGSGWRMF